MLNRALKGWMGPFSSRLVFIWLVLSAQQAYPNTLHVDLHAPVGGNGLSWATAYQSLESAIAQAHLLIPAPVEIRIAAGTYRPAKLLQAGNPTSARFVLRGNLTLRGGYAGITQPNPDLRDVNSYPTKLSGDLLGNDGPSFANYEDNAQFIVESGLNPTTGLLDGLTIESGRGALRVLGYQLTVVNCRFTRHSIVGAAYAIFNRNGALSMKGCSISDCGDWEGYPSFGALHCEGTSSTNLTNCVFTNISGGSGSAISNYTPASVACVNSLFTHNFGYDAAISNSGVITLTNCAIVSNISTKILSDSTEYAAGLATFGGTAAITNCIFWDNRNDLGISQESQVSISPNHAASVTINHSCMDGWTGSLGGVSNFGDDPLFVDPDGLDNIPNTLDDDYHLSDGSPYLDAGDNSADTDTSVSGPQSLPRSDLDGNPRFGPKAHLAASVNEAVVDLGPYEGGAAIINISQEEIHVPDDRTSSFTVWLSRAPASPVTVNIEPLVPGPITIDQGTQLLFDPDNFGTPQTVSVRADPDIGFIHDEIVIRLSANSYAPRDVLATQIDADPTPKTIFVRPDAVGLETGLDWANAFTSLQLALDTAETHTAIESVWVAQGSFYPERRTISLSPRSVTFRIPRGISIYGGFAGTEMSPGERDFLIHETILSGDLLQNDTGEIEDDSKADNAFQVVTVDAVQGVTRLDGLVFTAGHADKADPQANLKVGGGLYIESSSVIIDNSVFRENYAQYGGAIALEEGELQIQNTIFESNAAALTSGAIINGGALSISYCTFSNNMALDVEYASAGAVTTWGHTTIADSTFTGNIAGWQVIPSSIGSYGGALYAGGNVTILRTDFVDNYANSAGAIALFNQEPCSIVDCNFVENLAGEDGGAINTSSSAPVRIENCLFAGNRAQSPGYSNAAAIMSSWQVGPHIIGCDFIDNYAGSVQASGTVSLYGGWDAKGILSGCWFGHNRGGRVGVGSIDGYLIENCTFFDNYGNEHSAVILVDSDVANCRFIGNDSTNGSAAVRVSSNTNLTNCLVAGNSSKTAGGISAGGDGITITNCTIVGNTATQGPAGLVLFGNQPKVTNCIIANDTSDISGSGAIIKNCCIQSLPPEYAVGNNFSADPAFVDLDGPDNLIGTMDDDPSIAVSSPCANKGDDESISLPALDILGDPRIQACRVDIGAAESSAFSLADCNNNGLHDDCEVADGAVADCNNNFVPDSCDIANGSDADQDGVLDACQYLILRVMASASTGGDGSSWEAAISDLQGALALAEMHSSAVEIWVAAGTYRPSRSGDTEIAFQIPVNASLYGGFAGHETDAAQRDYSTNETILSGDYPDYDSNTIIDLSYGTPATILDGFTIRNSLSSSGDGAVYVYNGAPVIRNCRLLENRGCALFVRSASPCIEDCQFLENNLYGTVTGAQIDNGSQAVFERCAFENNERTSLLIQNQSTVTLNSCRLLHGTTAIDARASTLIMSDCLIAHFGEVGNSPAIRIYSSSQARIDHCTVANNKYLGAYLDYECTFAATNSIFWGNTGPGTDVEAWQIRKSGSTTVDVRSSCIQGLNSFAGFGNIGAIPHFVNEDAGNFRLLPVSPCADAGSSANSPEPIQYDLDGNPRLSGCEVDMGAYEILTGAPASADLNGDTVFSTDDVEIVVQLLLAPNVLGNCVADLDGNAQLDGDDIQALVDLILR